MLALALFGGLTSGLNVPAAHLRLLPTRAVRVFLSADADADATEARIKEAAARVVSAAALFGDTQGTAAALWVEEAMDACSNEECQLDATELMEKQMTLFEDCLVEDAFKCIELDLALTGLEKQLKEGSGPIDSFAGLFGQGKIDRALARVRTAAAKFGDEQERLAQVWAKEVRSSNGAMSPFALLEQQVALFDECMVDEDENKCKELNDALSALQASLGVRGKIMPTSGLMPK